MALLFKTLQWHSVAPCIKFILLTIVSKVYMIWNLRIYKNLATIKKKIFFPQFFEYMPTSYVLRSFALASLSVWKSSQPPSLFFACFSLFAYFMSQLSFLDLFKVDYFLASVFHPIVLFSHFFFLHGISCNYFVSLFNVFVLFALHLFVWDLREAETMSNLFNFVFQC